MIDWSDYPHFTEAEFRCKGKNCCGGQADMKPDFLMALERVRSAFGRPMIVTSGYRCPEHDQYVGGAGVHPQGQAADFWLSGEPVYHLLGIAYAMDIKGIGLKQHGAFSGRMIHLDTMGGRTRPRVWTYI